MKKRFKKIDWKWVFIFYGACIAFSGIYGIFCDKVLQSIFECVAVTGCLLMIAILDIMFKREKKIENINNISQIFPDADAIKYILNNLPAFISAENTNGKNFDFKLSLYINGTDDFRLAYCLCEKCGIEICEMWDNPYNNKKCDFLFLCENITSNKDLFNSAINCKDFLFKNKLYK